jgi:hypothetical protein
MISPRQGFSKASILSFSSVVFTSRFTFCSLVALLMVFLRVVTFDYHYFAAENPPNHDFFLASTFFTINMHSIRIGGDIAWWNPVSFNGYAQYYQSLFSAIAPDANHIVFVVWAQFIRSLNLLKIVIPEFYQFLIVAYIILPFLAFFTLAIFTSLIFRSRVTILLVLVVYTFSGIGLWNSAWFFFQMPFNTFFLLASAIALLQKPTPPRLLALLAALVIQITSFSYYSIYNSWFILIILGTYCWIHPNQLRRLAIRSLQFIKQNKGSWILVAVLCAITVGLWGLILASTVMEQSRYYVRGSIGEEAYTVEQAFSRVQEIRKFTTELFNPVLNRALQSYQIDNPVHNARYIGAFLLPLLVLFPAFRWGRREKWLITATVTTLIVCLAPPYLLDLWKIFPFMDRIVHLFYMYTQNWQFMLVLLAGCSLEVLMEGNYGLVVRRRFLFITGAMLGVAGLIIVGLGVFSQNFPANDSNLQSNLTFALLVLFSGIAILQFLISPTNHSRQLLVFIILALAFTDLTRYFWDVSKADRDYNNKTVLAVSDPLPAEVQAAIRRPWALPDLKQEFKGGLYNNMPVTTYVWPNSNYLFHLNQADIQKAPPDSQTLLNNLAYGPGLEFYPAARLIPNIEQFTSLYQKNPRLLLNQKELFLQENRSTTPVLTQLPTLKQENDLQLNTKDEAVWQTVNMKLLPGKGSDPAAWKVAADPQLIYTKPLDLCVADYSYFYISLAASPDIASDSRKLEIIYSLNNVKQLSSFTIPLLKDGQMHTYFYPLKDLKLDAKTRLTSLRVDPVVNGNNTGISEVQIADLRFTADQAPGQCESTVTTPKEATFNWQEWRYNTFSFEVNAPQDGWLLIRQINDPKWNLTVDGQTMQPSRANFAGIGLPLAQGHHLIRMDYQPLARKIYWPAGILLDFTLITLAVMAWRSRRRRKPPSQPLSDNKTLIETETVSTF